MNSEWIDIEDQLPENGQRVLAYIPENMVYLPGLMSTELREVITLHFEENFYPKGTEKWKKHGPHFWKGEGNSNHFFADVKFWRPMPKPPKNLK